MFRASLVGGVGYCARDKRHEVLSGSEQRSCWTASTTTTSEGFFDAVPAPDIVQLERGLLEILPNARPAPISER